MTWVNFLRCSTPRRASADTPGFCRAQGRVGGGSKLRGQGICYYIESILRSFGNHHGGVYGRWRRFDHYVGTQSNGRGTKTV